MKIKLLLFSIAVFSCSLIYSQDFDLNILSIPDSLTKSANSVIRFDETNVELLSQRKMIIKVRKAVTVLNKLGDASSDLTVHYDKNRRIKSLKAKVFNQNGKEIKKVPKKDFKDYAAADGISLFNDGRLKFYSHVPTSYPYSIYYEYEVESPNTAHLPRWFPIDQYNQSVQKSSYKISYPLDITINQLEKKFDAFKIKKHLTNNMLTYELNQITSIKYEENCPSYYEIMPWAMMSTNKFHLEGADGNAENWKDFGKWRYDYLYNGKDRINDITKSKVIKLVENINDPIEKAKIIYDFVQKKTRYISVQEGIGGWKPIKADEVDRLGYGDCKGLTNYTKTLLDAVGVTSYYSVIWAGESIKNVEKKLFSMQGNHVILNIPSNNGDVWLECTSQTDPFGYQGTFTDDRDVLVITPEGGEIKHTGIYEDENSSQKTLAQYKINNNGSIKGKIEINSAGVQYDDNYRLEKKTEKEVNKYYISNYWSYLNNLLIDSYSFLNKRDSIIFKENIHITAKDYATFSGNRMLFIINAFNRVSRVPKRYRNRKLPLKISRGFIDLDEFEIDLPEDYTIETIANNILIENKFGEYSFSIEKISNNKIKYSRKFLLKKGLYTKEDYDAYRNFRKQIAKYDKSKIVLIKK